MLACGGDRVGIVGYGAGIGAGGRGGWGAALGGQGRRGGSDGLSDVEVTLERGVCREVNGGCEGEETGAKEENIGEGEHGSVIEDQGLTVMEN